VYVVYMKKLCVGVTPDYLMKHYFVMPNEV